MTRRTALAWAALWAGPLLADAPPAWFKEASTAAHPEYAKKVPAVVLLNQEMVTVEDAERKTSTVRYAVKILNKDGIVQAQRGVSFYNKAGKLRDAKAWLISPSGKTKEYGKKELFERNYIDGVYDDIRYAGIDATDDADVGAVFGFEVTLEERTAFSQYQHGFQGSLPALRSAFTITVPAGWRAEGKLIGPGTLEATPSGNTYHWQLAKLAPIEDEPGRPALSAIVPRLVVSTFPPAGAATTATGHFETWRDVSLWTSKLVDPSVTVTPDIEARVKTLTAGATGFWERLRPLAAEAQGVRYISIQMNLARGGGYTPHTAAEVLRNAYGDCKDKANYLRTLLQAAGIESYLVTIYSGDPRHTRPEWPSPQQFNHAILAIRVPADTKLPAAFDHPKLGRMMCLILLTKWCRSAIFLAMSRIPTCCCSRVKTATCLRHPRCRWRPIC